MVCIICSGKTKVTNSRSQRKLHQTWRRRQCLDCGAVFTSIERIDLSKSLLVKNSLGRLEAFEREKLLLSVYDSLKHRKTALSDATSLTDNIISQIFKGLRESTITRNYIIETTSAVLKLFDKPSYSHYLAYHRIDS